MIYALLGPPGQGKSYEAVNNHIMPELPLKQSKKPVLSRVKDALKNKTETAQRYVVTNMYLNKEALEKAGYDLSYLITLDETVDYLPFSTIEDYEKYQKYKVEGSDLGPIFIIDECHKALPPRSRYDESSRDIEHWFKESRHASVDIVLITQDHQDVNRAIMSNTTIVKRMKKLAFLGANNTYKVFYFDNLRTKNHFRDETRKYEPKVYQFYQSYTKGGNGEAGIQDQKAIWNNWKFYGTIGLFVFLIYYFFTANPLEVFSIGVSEEDSKSTKKKNSSVGNSRFSQVPDFANVGAVVPEPSLCSHAFEGYQFTYRMTKNSVHYFNAYKNGIDFEQVVSSTQLIMLDYTLSSIYFDNIINQQEKVWIESDESVTGYTLEYQDTGFTKAQIFSAKLEHKKCDSYTQYITHLLPEKIAKKLYDSRYGSSGTLEPGGASQEGTATSDRGYIGNLTKGLTGQAKVVDK